MKLENKANKILDDLTKRNDNWEKVNLMDQETQARIDGMASSYKEADTTINENIAQTKIELQADNAILRKELSDTKKSLSTINANQEPKQTVNGHSVINLPKNASNGYAKVGLKGLTATNLIENGNFANGTTGWISMFANTLVVSDGVLTFRATTQWGQVNCSDLPMKKDEKMYYKVVVKSDAKVWLSHNGSAYAPQHSGNGQWEILSVVRTTPEDTLRGRTGVIDHRTSDWTDIQLKGVMLINLTQTFGAGNEPSKEECDVIFADYFEGTKSVQTPKRVKSVGKNLFDGELSTGNFNDIGNIINGGSLITKDFTKVIGGETYRLSGLYGQGDVWVIAYDENYKKINGTIWGQSNFKVPNGTRYIRFYKMSPNPVPQKPQIERGTVATPYEPYTSSTLHLNTNVELRSLPNGVRDEIRSDGQGGYELVKRVSDEVVTTNIGATSISQTEVDIHRIFSTLLNNASESVFTNPTGSTILINRDTNNKLIEVNGSSSAFNNVENIGKYFTSSSGIWLITGKGVIPTVNHALTYQLAEPIITPINVSGNLISYPSGTVYVENVATDAGLYTDKFTVLGLPIKTIDKLSKIDFTSGAETHLDVTKAVVSGTTFTHPDLKANDVVFVEYYYTGESTNPSTSLEFYDSRYTIKDSVTNKFYKWNVKIANGVATLGTEEV